MINNTENKHTSKEKVVYSCERCGKMYYERERADLCCNDKSCRKCGTKIDKKDYYMDCVHCRNKAKIEKENELFNNANKLTVEEYTNQFPNHPFFLNDNYYHELEYLEDEYFDDEENMPKYVWGTSVEKVELDYYDIIERFEEGVRLEDYEADKVAIDELKEFCKQWNDKHAPNVYWQDTSIVVLL